MSLSECLVPFSIKQRLWPCSGKGSEPASEGKSVADHKEFAAYRL